LNEDYYYYVNVQERTALCSVAAAAAGVCGRPNRRGRGWVWGVRYSRN